MARKKCKKADKKAQVANVENLLKQLSKESYMDPNSYENANFVMDRNGFVHMKDCPHIDHAHRKNLKPITRFQPGKMTACKECERELYTSVGARDFFQNREKYKKLFEEANFTTTSLQKFFVENRCLTKLVGRKMYVAHEYEDWCIEFLDNGEVSLWHNNYTASRDNAGRFFKNGFHRHDLSHPKINIACRNICSYDKKLEHRSEDVLEKQIKNELNAINNEENRMMRKSGFNKPENRNTLTLEAVGA